MSLTLIPIGTAKREKTWPVPGSHDRVTCRYDYFYILADDLGVASNLRWYISSSDLEREVAYDDVKRLFVSNPPKIGFWERRSLLIIFCVVVVFVFLGY